jgi:hypothetical protein
MRLSLRYFINRNIQNFLVVFAVMVSFTAFYVVTIWPSIINMASAPFDLNYQSAFVQDNLLSIEGGSNISQPTTDLKPIIEDVKNDKSSGEQFQEILKMSRNPREVNIKNQSLFDYENAYNQNSRYKFKIIPISVYDLGLSYETMYSIKADGIKTSLAKPAMTHKYVLLDTGKAMVLAKVPYDFVMGPNQMYKGVFLPLTKVLVEDVQKVLGQGYQINNIFIYELDTMTSFSYYEYNEILMLFVLIIITLAMGIKFIFYIIDYRRHPTYKQLRKLFGDQCENELKINAELADNTKMIVYKGVYTTDNWQIKQGVFKTRISIIKRKSRFDS